MKTVGMLIALSMVVFCFGCAGPRVESARDQTMRCARLVGERRAAIEALTEAKKAITDSKVLECQRIFQENYIFAQCHAEHLEDGLGYYGCVLEKMNSKGAKVGFGPSRQKGCNRLYDRFIVCSNEVSNEFFSEFKENGRKKFISECQKDFDSAEPMIQCTEKVGCSEFFKCALGVDLTEKKKEALEMKKQMEQEEKSDPPSDSE